MMSLAIKREGKYVDLEHIRGKISRDSKQKFSDDETRKLLDGLIDKKLVQERGGEFAISGDGRKYFESRWRKIRDDLNPDYLKIYRAKQYYPHVAETLLEFFKDRWVSVFRLFTGKAWLQRKLGPKYITIKSEKDVQKWLDIHGMDFIPYIHRIDVNRPDWLVVDFDAGEKVGLEKTKNVVRGAYDIFKGYRIKPSLKFSGSRGFQLWAKFERHELPNDYVPKQLRSGKRERNMFGFYADIVRFVESKVAEESPA